MPIITYPLLPPATPAPRDLMLRPQSAVGLATSPFTFQSQAQVHAGQRWVLSFALPPLVGRSAFAPWGAFLTGLNGMEGTFLMGDPFHRKPRGVATGTPLVDGADQTGGELATKGWTVSVAGILKADDFIQLGSGAGARLHKVLADVDSDGSGEAVLPIWPRLRASPADEAVIVTENCVGVFRLRGNEPDWTRALNVFGVRVDAVEVV